MSEVVKLPASRPMGKGGYIWTPTYDACLAGIESLLAMGGDERIAVMIGGAGTGKTAFLRAIESRRRLRIVLDPSSAGLRLGLLRTLERFPEYHDNSGHLRATYRIGQCLAGELEDRDFGPELLMFDEAQQCFSIQHNHR